MATDPVIRTELKDVSGSVGIVNVSVDDKVATFTGPKIGHDFSFRFLFGSWHSPL